MRAQVLLEVSFVLGVYEFETSVVCNISVTVAKNDAGIDDNEEMISV